MGQAPLHVLLVTTGYPPEHSGSGGRLHAMYRRLINQHPALSWSVLSRCDAPAPAIEGPTTIHRVPRVSRAHRPITEWAAVRRHTRRGMLQGCDILHCAGWSWLTLAVCRTAKRAGLPILRELTTIGDGAAHGAAGARLIRHTNRLADQLIAISPALERDVRSTGVTAPIWCRPNPVDSDLFHLPQTAERQTARALVRQWLPSLTDDDVLLLQVGRIRPLKNQQFMLECLGRLPPRFKLLIVGPPQARDDPYLRDLRARAATPDLAGRVHIEATLRNDVPTLMRAADALTFPSRSEGLGNVVVEALASGLPVVAHHLPGVTDWLIEPGVNGALAPLDPADFVAAILQAEPQRSQRSAIAAAAATRFDRSQIDDRYWRILTQLAARTSLDRSAA